MWYQTLIFCWKFQKLTTNSQTNRTTNSHLDSFYKLSIHPSFPPPSFTVWCDHGVSGHLLEFLHHLLDVQVWVVSHFVLHLREPLTQLLVLLIEDDPGVKTICDLLLTQRHLRHRDDERKGNFQKLYDLKMLGCPVFNLCVIITDTDGCIISIQWIRFGLIKEKTSHMWYNLLKTTNSSSHQHYCSSFQAAAPDLHMSRQSQKLSKQT